MSIPRDRFTIRELEVMKRIGAGKTYPEIAAELRISERTVRLHAANTRNKLPALDDVCAVDGLEKLDPKPAIIEFLRRIAA